LPYPPIYYVGGTVGPREPTFLPLAGR